VGVGVLAVGAIVGSEGARLEEAAQLAGREIAAPALGLAAHGLEGGCALVLLG
jgi:hypothetical protein